MNTTIRLFHRVLLFRFALFGVFILPSFTVPGAAQVEAGIMGGGSFYGGDIGPDGPRDYLRQMRLSYGVFVRYRINPYISTRFHYQDLDLFGEDDLSKSIARRERNFHFYSDLDEIAFQIEIHPFRDKLPVSPYLVGGVAGYHFNPKAYYNGAFIDLQPLGTEGQGLPGFEEKYALTRISVPIGGGLRFNFGRGMYFGLQISARATFFDYLDDVSGDYVSESTLIANGPLAVELAYRGDEVPGEENSMPSGRRGGESNDYYYSATAQFSYQFNNKKSSKSKSKKRKVSCFKF